MTIRDLPPGERPRERLVERGAGDLSSIELLAILLGTGTRERSALGLASFLLTRFGSLEELTDATLQELLTVKGIGIAKAVKLQAAFHLFKRLRPQHAENPLIDSASSAYREVLPLLENEKLEVLALLLRNARKRVIHKEIIGRGILDKLLVHPREVFCTAIRRSAHSIIVVHNHPSGDPTPSIEDIQMTKILWQAGKIVGIEVVDHIIIGNQNFHSFHENGNPHVSGY